MGTKKKLKKLKAQISNSYSLLNKNGKMLNRLQVELLLIHMKKFYKWTINQITVRRNRKNISNNLRAKELNEIRKVNKINQI